MFLILFTSFEARQELMSKLSQELLKFLLIFLKIHNENFHQRNHNALEQLSDIKRQRFNNALG